MFFSREISMKYILMMVAVFGIGSTPALADECVKPPFENMIEDADNTFSAHFAWSFCAEIGASFHHIISHSDDVHEMLAMVDRMRVFNREIPQEHKDYLKMLAVLAYSDNGQCRGALADLATVFCN
ncbi:MAG: hypothetical protein D6698_09020, partial [Gammaproteobacteria bacterium]